MPSPVLQRRTPTARGWRYILAFALPAVLAALWAIRPPPGPTELRLRESFNSRERVSHLAYSPDGKTLVVGGRDGAVELWDATNRRERLQLKTAPRDPNTGHSYPVAAFSADGRTLAVGAMVRQGAVRVYDPADGRELATLPGTEGASALGFTPDGKMLVVVQGSVLGPARSIVVKLWDTADWRERPGPPPFRTPSAFMIAALSPDAATLALGEQGGGSVVALFDLPGGRKRADLMAPSAAGKGKPALNSFAFSPDGRTLAMAYDGGVVLLWDTVTAGVRSKLRSDAGDRSVLSGLTFTPDGRSLAAYRGVLPSGWGDLQNVLPAALRPDSPAAITPRLVVWDIVTGGLRAIANARPESTYSRMAVSPDGGTVAASDIPDGTVLKFWDLSLPPR